MRCEDCELLLAEAEVDVSVEDHLRSCAVCRSFQEDLRANTLALGALRDEALPPVKAPRPQSGRPWMSAAAAAALLVLVGYQIAQWKPQVERLPRPRVLTDTLTVTADPGPQRHRQPAPRLPVRRKPTSVPLDTPPGAGQPLLVKMLTPDPDVVVYWLVD